MMPSIGSERLISAEAAGDFDCCRKFRLREPTQAYIDRLVLQPVAFLSTRDSCSTE